MITRKKLLTVAVSTSLAGALLASNTLFAADASLDAAAKVLEVTADTAPATQEGKCGEGKCGGDKKDGKEGKCGEGKCGGDKKEGKEGKCGEAK
jgi:uncharacterized low-complexity protein